MNLNIKRAWEDWNAYKRKKNLLFLDLRNGSETMEFFKWFVRKVKVCEHERCSISTCAVSHLREQRYHRYEETD